MSIEIPDEPEESDTSRDGVFSYATEWHAFSFMFGLGLLAYAPPFVAGFGAALLLVSATARGYDRFNKGLKAELRAEAWYAAGGLAVGMITSFVFNVVMTLL